MAECGGEPTLRAFCERVQPFASAFMALFGRADFPTPPTLSRYLAVLDQPSVEALRTLFLEDLVARTPFGMPPGGLWDRLGGQWLLMDVDGTKQAARQRALPATPDLPPVHRRFDRVCAPGHLGRKRGEVARTRTTILQAHTHQWLGTFGNPGNGHYRQELKQARAVIATYAHALSFPLSHMVIRLDGLYGDAAPLADLLAAGSEAGAEGPAVVVRGKAYHLLEQPGIQQRLKLPPDQMTVHPESGASRALYDCGQVQLAPTGLVMRMLLTTYPAESSRPPIGKVREGTALMNNSSRPCHTTRLRLQMCSICICIGVRSRQCSLMKMRNKRSIAGYRERSGARRDDANHQSMDVEPALGVWAASTGDHDARDGPGLFAGAEAFYTFS
jgi:hypothetical protein